MQRTTIMLPKRLKMRAEAYARQHGVSLGELIRGSLGRILDSERSNDRSDDPLFADDAVFRGDAPNDVARKHDEYLYEDHPE